MIRNRLIPVLLNSDRGLVKTKNFRNPRYVGDSLNTVKIFSDKCVDEIMILDIDRSPRNLGPNLELLKSITKHCFVPISYGGGVRNLIDAKKVLDLGVEKIVIQDAVIKDPKVIESIVDYAGSSSVTISIDVLTSSSQEYMIYQASKKRILKTNFFDYLDLVRDSGCGEILLTSVNHEGCRSGFNLELISEVSQLLTIPLVIHGGAGCNQDLADALDAGAQAVAAGSLFLFYTSEEGVLLNYPRHQDVLNLVRSANVFD
jgi:cyclase